MNSISETANHLESNPETLHSVILLHKQNQVII